MEYDVLVIGAGPAGSTAAKILAERGLRVTLFERRRLPRYKSCSGILIDKSLRLVRQYFGELPAFVTCAPAQNRGMIFTADNGREYAFNQPGANVWRHAFDGWLTDEAARSGTEVCDNALVTACTERADGVEAIIGGRERDAVRARYAVVCCGCASVLPYALRARTPEYVTTFQTFNDGVVNLDPHYFYAYLQPELSEYDAWFNVKENRIVLGVAVRDPKKISLYYARFVAYMREKHGLRIDKELRREKWVMPHITSGEIAHGAGRILWAGECAGFLHPMGEGISAALESGAFAAQAVCDNFPSPADARQAYKKNTAGMQEYMRRQWEFLGRISPKFYKP